MQGLLVLLRIRFLQLCALVALLTGVGVIAFQSKYCVLDADIGWHLKVGDWIIDHLAVPHTGILSRTAANRPWVAYSWGYELMLSRAYATRIGRTASRRLFQPRPSPTIRLSARATSPTPIPRTNDLSPAPLPLARHHRAHSPNPPLSHYPPRPANPVALHPCLTTCQI